MLLTVVTALVGREISARIDWRDLPPMPVGAAGGAVALVSGTKLLYAGGTTWVDGAKQWLRDVHQYDLVGGSWAPGPALPEPLAYGASVTTADRFEILGGMNEKGPSTNCWRLDSGLRRWVKTGVLPRNAILARVEQVKGAAYLFGGCSDTSAPMRCSDDVWMRDGREEWTRIGTMPDGTVALRASSVADNQIYLFGGCSEESGGVVNRDGAYRFNPATGEWRKLRPLPVAVRGLSAANLGGGRILLAGGYTATAYQAASFGPNYGFSNQVLIYYSNQDRYESATQLPFAASGIGIVTHEGAILALGGEDRMRSRSRRCIRGKIE